MTGTLRRSDFGAGGWVLEVPGGERYALDGLIPADLDGRRVEVQGRVVEAFGFGGGEPVLLVESIRPA